MALDTVDQIDRFRDFFETHHLEDIHKLVGTGKRALIVDFSALAQFDPDLAEQLLNEPEDTLKSAELSIDQFDIGTLKIHVRVRNLPLSEKIFIKNLRSEHLSKFIMLEGIIRQASDVRPQVVSAKFECPSCGNNISILQIDTKFKEPTRCSCGRRGKFRLLTKSLVDAQRLIVEENPENLEGGEQPKRLSIFLKEDLVEPIMEKKTTPGSLINVTGVVKEIPVFLKTGAQSVRYDLMMESVFIEPVEETFEELEIGKEDEEKILALASDPQIYEKLRRSMAPTIFGHDDIKEALVLMLMGGVKKERLDGTKVKGDIHILLVGDPGSAKSTLLTFISHSAPKARYVAGRGASGAGLCVSPNSLILTNPGGMETIETIVEKRLNDAREYRPGIWKKDTMENIRIQTLSHDLTLQSKKPKTVWKLTAPDELFEIILSSGKKIEITANTKLLTIKHGKLLWKESMNLNGDEFIATPRVLLGGTKRFVYTVDTLQSNPVLHDIKHFIKKANKDLIEKYGTLRKAANSLGVPENSLYHHWVNVSARGNIKLHNLRKIYETIHKDWKRLVKKVSLYNGKTHHIPLFLDKDFFYFAGLIAGDGDIREVGNGYSIRLSNSNAFLHHFFRNYLRKKWNLHYDVQFGNTKRPESTRTHSKLLFESLHYFGIPLSPKSHRIYLADTLLHLSNNVLSEYIAGLYDTDGSVYIRNTGGSDCIELTTCSEKLARQLQLVFLRFGIHARLRNRKPSVGKIKGVHLKWVLEIRGHAQFKLFNKHIKLRHPEKKKRLAKLIKRSVKYSTNVDVIPEVSLSLKKALQNKRISLRKVRWHKNLSRNFLQNIVSNISDESFSQFKKLAFSDIFWEKIVSINKKNCSYNYVYDLTVENSHNFVVNGFLVHNTATVVKDEFLRGWALEAGALVLANKGTVCIDEMDKIEPDDVAFLHEAMAQQQVSISKANVQATLRCETTVLAAANPKLGRFDPYQPIAAQINMPPALINRFDLIFPVRDIPSKEMDEKIASHILNLQIDTSLGEPEIPRLLLKKYISYVRRKVFPVLDKGCMDEISHYYVHLRNSGTVGEEVGIRPIPISARQLEALSRLAEASARVRLSKKATRADARRAIRILNACLTAVGLDPKTGLIDIDRIATGISATQRNKILVIKDILIALEKNLGKKSIPLEDLISEASSKGLTEEEVDEVVTKLKREGEIFEPRRGFISRI